MSSVFGTGRVAYPGLRAFSREEFDLFFGRESCVDEMVDTLGRTCFLAVLGTSGSGKSSLVRTGLLNSLELGFLASAGSTWRIAEMRPRGHPIRSLAITLLAIQGIDRPEEAEVEILSAFLRRGPRSLIEWANSGHLPPRANLIVLADQFEELFRYEDYSGREEAEAFVKLLVTAAREDVPIYVAITMRSEYLGACTLIDGLPEVINRGLYLTPRMTREECRQAIVGPAEVCGFRIEDGLVNKLLNDLTDFAPWEAGGGHDQQRRLGRRADQLPLMQHVLNLLWQKARARNETDIVLTLADYEAAGGLGGALDRHADDIAASVPKEYADAIDPVFRSLVTGKTIADAVRRPTRFGELVELAGGDRDGVAAVVDAFRAQGVNFFTPGEPEPLLDDTIIDISHESLIRQWRRLSRCLDEEAHSADAWHQLLSRSERYEHGAGGLLTGLDLDNLVDWWERTRPTAAWANRYGNNFDEAQKFLRDSQFAEADLKRREEEEARKLIAAEEEANTGRRFKRLAVALAAALILAFAATGAAIYLWRESNAEALAALAAQEEAARQAALAEAAKAEAEKQAAAAEEARTEAERQAAAAELARQDADEQRAIAEAKAAEAEEARQDAEEARAEAEAARAQADQIIDTSIAYFAKSLGEEVASIQGDSGAIQNLGYAGSLLSRLAEDTRGKLAAGTDVDTSFIDALRPAFVVQDALSAGAVPSVEPAPTGDATRWVGLAGGAGLNALADWNSRVLRLSDRSGRVVAGHDLPESFWGAQGETPIAATDLPDGTPVAVLADTIGQLWVGSGGTGPLAPVAGGDLAIVRIDDVMADPAGGRVFVAYRLGRVGENGQSMFGSGLRVAVLEPGPEGFEVAAFHRMPRGVFGGDEMPFQLVGVDGATVTVVADGQIVRTDLDAERSTALDIPGVVIDAGLTADGRYVLAGGLRDESGTCFEPAQRDGFNDPWRGGDSAPQPAGLVIEPVGPASVPAVTRAPTTAADCLLLYDVTDDLPLWRGAAGGTRFDTLRTDGDGAVAVVEGSASGLGVLRIGRHDDDSWTGDRLGTFEPAAWGLAGFGDLYAATATTGEALPVVLTADTAGALMRNGVLHLLAAAEPAGRVIAWRIAADEVQIVRASGADGGETAFDVLVYRPGQAGFVADDRIDAGRVACLPREGDATCRVDAAALSPDGNWLLVTSNGSHAFVGPDGMLSGWQPNAGGEDGDAVATTLTFAALAPLDAEGQSFIASTVEDGRLRRITRLSSMPQPQGLAEDRFFRQIQRPFDLKPGDGGSGSEGSGSGTGGIGGISGGSAVTVVSEVRLPGNVVSDLAGFVTDPERAVLYVWGPRIGLRAVPAGAGGDGDMLTADVEFSSPIADVAPLAGGDVAVATTDGQLTVVPAARFVRNPESGAEPETLEAVSTGLGSFGAIDLWADGDRVVANAGKSVVAVEGDEDGGWSPPPLPIIGGGGVTLDQPDLSKIRSLGFRRDGDAGLVPTFVVPWEHVTGQLDGGEAVSIDSGGEVFAPPRPLPADDRLLALAIMREAQSAEETPEFEIGFDMLHMRFAGEGEAGAQVDNCGWVLGVAVRMAGELQETVGEDVRRACDEPAVTAPVVNAIFDDRIDERIAALVRLAPQSPLAMAVLVSSLRAVAPEAAQALGAAEAGSAPDRWEATLAAIAENGSTADLRIDPAGPGFDPFAHWMVAMAAERGQADAAGLAEALFHYAYAERLFQAAGVAAPSPVVKRRLALARILSDDVVIDTFDRLEAAPLDPAAAGAAETELNEVPLDDVSAWLDGIAADDEAKVKRLESLAALVEELKGDDLGDSDPAAAADHYRAALALVIGSDEALSEHPGILGKIEEAEEIGAKLAVLGDATARADTAFAVLRMIDATLTQPVRRDADPPELRTAIAGAFTDLAAAGAAGYDLSGARDLALGFLDFDWEARYQSINQVGADRFYHELAAAEAFAGAALAEADEADRLYWLGLRGRMRFWLSTLENESLPYEPAVFRDWLSGALADYAAAGGPDTVRLWDATIIGGANSRMIELAASDREAIDYLEAAAAAFRSAIDRAGQPDGVIGADGKPEDFLDLNQYHRRLAYDGFVLALERAIIRLRGDRFLSGVGAQPGTPEFDRKLLAEIGYISLDLARRREALRGEAEVNALIEPNSTWSLDTRGDFYWGTTVAQLGALMRVEAGLNGTPDLCDRLAAHPYDVTRPTAAVDYDALDVDSVLTNCDDDSDMHRYYQARALAKAGTAEASEQFRLLLPSALEGLPIAYNNIALLVSDAGGSNDDVQNLMSTFSELSLIKAYPQVAALLRDQQTSAVRAEAYEWLAHKAAALGVPEAYIDIAELTPDVLTRAFNYTVARNLFREAGRTAEADAMQARIDAFDLSASNVNSVEAQAASVGRVEPKLLDEETITRIEDLLWDARGQASLQ